MRQKFIRGVTLLSVSLKNCVLPKFIIFGHLLLLKAFKVNEGFYNELRSKHRCDGFDKLWHTSEMERK